MQPALCEVLSGFRRVSFFARSLAGLDNHLINSPSTGCRKGYCAGMDCSLSLHTCTEEEVVAAYGQDAGLAFWLLGEMNRYRLQQSIAAPNPNPTAVFDIQAKNQLCLAGVNKCCSFCCSRLQQMFRTCIYSTHFQTASAHEGSSCTLEEVP